MRPKLVFWLKYLQAFIKVVAILIAVLIYYLAWVFLKSISTTTRIVFIIIRDDIDQVGNSD